MPRLFRALRREVLEAHALRRGEHGAERLLGGREGAELDVRVRLVGPLRAGRAEIARDLEVLGGRRHEREEPADVAPEHRADGACLVEARRDRGLERALPTPRASALRRS